ncbi:hypothetical protein YTPLAS18_33750 [Nitrospira sp.]|nr:hypothetical protein YTPLAS18_33750 [Nitrospira sp.]
MGKQLPVVPAPTPVDPKSGEEYIFSRVFCLRENAPPLKLLVDFLRSRNQSPILPKMEPEALEDWAWVQVSMGYEQERKPIQMYCLRDRGTYKEGLEQERTAFLDQLSMYDDIEAGLVRDYVNRARFVLTTRMVKNDVNDAGYDFNGWILQFFQENCDGVVQIDGQGFYAPTGDLVVEMLDPTGE